MKSKLFLTIVCALGIAIIAAGQTKDPMKGMDMSHMNHAMPVQKKTTTTKKKVVSKKTTAKKISSKKPITKSVVKKKPAPKTSVKKTTMDPHMPGMDMSSKTQKADTMPGMQHMQHMTMTDTTAGHANMHMQTGSMDHMNMHDTSKPGMKPQDHMNMNMDMHNINGHDPSMRMGHDTMNMSNMHGNHDMAGMDMPGMDHMDMGSMSHAYSLNLPMSRDGSGTGWLPDASPMYGHMIHNKQWMYMVHGSIWLRYNDQDYTHQGVRGDSRFDAPNWGMFMGQRKVGHNGLFHFSTMFSLDPVFEGGRGYPLLFQTGESWQGKPLVDRQHPHDLISELAVAYSHAFSKQTDVFVYLGYPGEPALGPVTFMHRPSSLDNPNAPISHHWVDATHITFGVATIGVRLGQFKLEGSSFTGREPNENRYDFDKARFDSWSGRLSFNPSKNWALQVSHGYVKSPETLHPEENIYKITASAIYSINFGNERSIDATALWGQNKQKGENGENAVLLEAAWRNQRNALYTRYEWTQKSAEELVLENIFDPHTIFPVHAFTIGDNYDFFTLGKIRVAGGGQWSIYHAPSSLNNICGKNPMAFQVFIRLYPSLMKM